MHIQGPEASLERDLAKGRYGVSLLAKLCDQKGRKVETMHILEKAEDVV